MTESESGAASTAPRDPLNPGDALIGWLQDIAPYGIFITDADLVIRSWNQWLATHSGLPSSAVLGHSLTTIFPDIEARGLNAHFARALRGEVAVLSTALHKYLLKLPPTVREPDLPHMLQTARIAPLPAGEQIVGTITIIEDVTQRETQAAILFRQQEHDRLRSATLATLLESEQPLQAVSELFPRLAAPLKLEAYFHYLLDPDGKTLRLHAAGGVSPEAKKMLGAIALDEGPSGCAAKERQPVVLARVHQDSSSAAAVARRLGLRSYASFPLLIGERVLGTLDFASYERELIEPHDLELLATIAQYLAIATDRALRERALREAQESLREHAENLETKVAERTARLHETIAQLESFSYTIAHDLRAPIRSLKGFSEILLTDYAENVPADGRTLLMRLQRASHRLDALTRDLLKFSRIARQDVQLGPVDIDELVREISGVTPGLHDTLTVASPLGTVWAQRTLLQQCLANLFDNALKFITPGATPKITVRSETRAAPGPESRVPSQAFNPAIAPPAPEEDRRASQHPFPNAAGPRVRIWIEDNGIGIPAHAHEKIFGIFERVSGLDSIEGTGIGLAIVARATQQMGGTCGVVSDLGTGSRFWIELASTEGPPPLPLTATA